MVTKTSDQPITIQNYYGMVLLVEAVATNPQGDPGADNRPRQLPDGRGLITASGIKRKIRDMAKLDGEDIYVARSSCFEATDKKVAGADYNKPEVVKILAKNFFDVRAFGQLVARITTAVRGPVQFSNGISLDPIEITEHSITRCAVASEKERDAREAAKTKALEKREEALEKRDPKTEDLDDDESAESDAVLKTMGRSSFVTYGLYRFDITVNPHDAFESGYTEEDHKKLISIMLRMFQNDAASGRMLKIKKLHQFSMPMKNAAGKISYAPISNILDMVTFEKSEGDISTVMAPALESAIEAKRIVSEDLLKKALKDVLGDSGE